MTVKSHAFGLKLMLDEAIEDAVHSDMFFMESIKKLNEKEQINIVVESFKINEKTAETIIKNELQIAIFEASSLVNSDINDLSKVRTLRQKCNESGGILAQKLIEKMVDKYLTTIKLFALNMSPHAQHKILTDLNITRRNAIAVRNILEKQIKNAKNFTQKNTPVAVVKHRINKFFLHFEDNIKEIENPQYYLASKVVLLIATKCETQINKLKKDSLDKVFSLVESIKQAG